MTLVEVVVSLAISGLVVGGVLHGYIYCVNAAEKSALSLVANAKATERLEATRSAKWDTASYPPVDELVETNFPDMVVMLDLSRSGARANYATNQTRISQISVTPPLKRVRVDCIWRFRGSQLITNTIETCRAPDQ